MTSTLEMALEALEWADNFHNEGEPVQVRIAEAIAALKEAIKNQGEPVAFIRHHPNGNKELIWSMDWRFDQQDHTPLYTSAPTIPEGWQLVPVAPTPKMIHEGQMSRLCPVTGSESAAAIYKAMLSAAPKGDKP